LQGITRAESSWALVKGRELTSLGDICGADVRMPFLETPYQEAIAHMSCETSAMLTKSYDSVLQGLAATTLPHEIARRPRSDCRLQRHAWRNYSSSEEYGKHVEALITSGIAPPSALRSLWDDARSRSDPRQAVIMAAIGFYLADLPKTIAATRQAVG